MKKGLHLVCFPITLALAAAAFLGSCSLLPVEEEAPAPPLLRSYEKTEYTFAEATNGDIIEKLRVTAQYSPALEESLAFPVGGIRIDNVYVENGDVVKKGDLLAELDRSALKTQIDAQSSALDKLRLSRTQLKEAYQLNLKAENIKLDALQDEYAKASAANKAAIQIKITTEKKTITSLTDNYELQLDVYNTKVGTAAQKLSELYAQYDQRALVAGIDGTVTYIKVTDPYSTSVENEKFLTIADKTSSVFIVSGDDAQNFKPGDAVVISISSEDREATVMDASELGLAPDDRMAYVRLNETAFDIKERATGSITLVMDKRENVLFVPKNAVKSANGKSIVYCVNESGIKVMREIETGFVADNKVEVLSGLEAGEQVIIE